MRLRATRTNQISHIPHIEYWISKKIVARLKCSIQTHALAHDCMSKIYTTKSVVCVYRFSKASILQTKCDNCRFSLISHAIQHKFLGAFMSFYSSNEISNKWQQQQQQFTVLMPFFHHLRHMYENECGREWSFLRLAEIFNLDIIAVDKSTWAARLAAALINENSIACRDFHLHFHLSSKV